jgi:hypothetical protein
MCILSLGRSIEADRFVDAPADSYGLSTQQQFHLLTDNSQTPPCRRWYRWRSRGDQRECHSTNGHRAWDFPHDLVLHLFLIRTDTKERSVPEKSPQKPAGKKPGKSLKEKRDAKREKKAGRSTIGH